MGFEFMDADNQIINSKPGPSKDDQVEQRWEENFAVLLQNKELTGSVNVKRIPENKVLYNWIMSQRVEYKKLASDGRSKLTAAKIQRLNDVGFSFAKRPKYLKWDDRLEQLKEYKAKHGHLKIPINDAMLGEFAGRQRSEYTKFLEGKKDIGMNAMRVQELKDLGFVFLLGKRVPIERRMTKRKTWDERFQELIEFREEYGHTLVPQHSVCGLGEWVHQQRKNYKLLKAGKPSALSTERTIRLSDTGFIFDAAGHRRMRKFADAENDEKQVLEFADL